MEPIPPIILVDIPAVVAKVAIPAVVAKVAIPAVVAKVAVLLPITVTVEIPLTAFETDIVDPTKLRVVTDVPT